jgi:hypothetical protein
MKDGQVFEKIHRFVHVLYVAGPNVRENLNIMAINNMNSENVINKIVIDELKKIIRQIPQMQPHQVNTIFSPKLDKRGIEQIRANRIIISPTALPCDRYFLTERFIDNDPKLTHLIVMTSEESDAPNWPKMNCFIEKLDFDLMPYVIADIMLDISMVHSLAALLNEQKNSNCDELRTKVDENKKILIKNLDTPVSNFYFKNITLFDYISFAWLCRDPITKELDVKKYIQFWRDCCEEVVDHVVKDKCFLLSTHRRRNNLCTRNLRIELDSLAEGEYLLILLEKTCKTTEQIKKICGIFNITNPKLNSWLILPKKEGEKIAKIQKIAHLISTYPIFINK